MTSITDIELLGRGGLASEPSIPKNGAFLEPNSVNYLSHRVLDVYLPPIDGLQVGTQVTLQRTTGNFSRPVVKSMDASIVLGGVGFGSLFSTSSQFSYEHIGQLVLVWSGVVWHELDFTGADDNLFLNERLFTESGTFVVPTGITQISVDIVAGGGAGGAGNVTRGAYYGSGGGGAGAGILNAVIDVNPGDSFDLIVGAGGVGAPDQSFEVGGSGGNSSFGDILVVGGGGGGGATGNHAAAHGQPGLGGLVITNSSVSSEAFDGGRGGYGGFSTFIFSGAPFAREADWPNTIDQVGQNGQDVNGFFGGIGGDRAGLSVTTNRAPGDNGSGGGGGASAFADGGNGGVNNIGHDVNTDGSAGSGGGGAIYMDDGTAGGDGMINIKWDV